jgi:hypothetical protein
MYPPTFWITTYGALRQPPTATSPVGQGEAVERRPVGALDHLEAGPRRRVEPRCVERLRAREVGAQGLRQSGDVARRRAAEPGAEIGLVAGIEPERSGAAR